MIETDFHVGRVLNFLDRKGLTENTLVIFSSDNGPERSWIQRIEEFDHDSSHIYKEGKRSIYEGGHRVAGIVSFPSVVPPTADGGAAESWETVVTMDFLPTVMEILNVDRPPSQRDWAMDGRSILSLLKNPSTFRWQDYPDGPREIGIGYYAAEFPKMIGW